MKKTKLRLITLILAAALLLTGCDMVDFGGYFGALKTMMTGGDTVVPYESMEYARPDMTQIRQALDDACAVAADGESAEAVMDAVYAFYDAYD